MDTGLMLGATALALAAFLVGGTLLRLEHERECITAYWSTPMIFRHQWSGLTNELRERILAGDWAGQVRLQAAGSGTKREPTPDEAAQGITSVITSFELDSISYVMPPPGERGGFICYPSDHEDIKAMCARVAERLFRQQEQRERAYRINTGTD